MVLHVLTSFRTPKLYATFIQKDQLDTYPTYCLIIDFIEGDTLSETLWLDLDDEAQKAICSKLSEQCQLLRSIPAEGYYGRVHHQGWQPWLNLSRTRGKSMTGPHETYEDLVSDMYTTAKLRAAKTNAAPEFHPRSLAHLSQFISVFSRTKGFRPILTHLDPKWQNIISRPVKEMGDGDRFIDWDVVLIDWDTLGWLPSFIQGAALGARILLDNETKVKFNEMMLAGFEDSYPVEVKYLEEIYQAGSNVYPCGSVLLIRLTFDSG